MGDNKKTRKRIAGEVRVIAEHLEKIDAESKKPRPDLALIAKWEKDIVRHSKLLEKYSGKLPGKKE